MPTSAHAVVRKPTTSYRLCRRQMIAENLPRRRDQLYKQYGPGGPVPLIPDAQPSALTLAFGAVTSTSVQVKIATKFAQPPSLAIT